ncbi:vegetative cell wall protein gp1-like [Phragmites australis]|uniref:vegetative cell wall protein gp1-like n=1 Tax=Phragmites australis TaxID=29695 RepID=UPI002D76ED54|nr:vegetative cell wall protein gp1-like [Phragmites australis]
MAWRWTITLPETAAEPLDAAVPPTAPSPRRCVLIPDEEGPLPDTTAPDEERPPCAADAPTEEELPRSAATPEEEPPVPPSPSRLVRPPSFGPRIHLAADTPSTSSHRHAVHLAAVVSSHPLLPLCIYPAEPS